MSYISKGDLLVTSSGEKVIATSDTYDRRVAGSGEFLEDWTLVPTVDVIYPATGIKGSLRLSYVTKAK